MTGLLFNQALAEDIRGQYRLVSGAGEAWFKAVPPGGAALRGGVGLASYLCREIGDTGPSPRPHGALSVVGFNVPPERMAEVERWYDTEHADILIQDPDWLRVRRLRVEAQAGGEPYTHFAVHELAHVETYDSPQRHAARATPWRLTLGEEAWFQNSGRWLYRRIAP